MSERKEKVEKIYFETERKKSSKCKENIGAFSREENIGKIPTFPEGRKVYYYIIYIFGHKPPENLF